MLGGVSGVQGGVRFRDSEQDSGSGFSMKDFRGNLWFGLCGTAKNAVLLPDLRT